MNEADALKIGWTRAQSGRQRVRYRWLLGCLLLVEFAVGVALLIVPAWIAGFAGEVAPGMSIWVRITGVMMLTTTVFQLSGWFNPLYQRWPNILGILWRIGLAALCACLGGRFWILALAEVGAAVLLALLYWRLMRAELMSRP
jgi:hypothetical protein